jgi:hypothetical protein
MMIVTMLVDIDHLLATPIYDPLRCSIGFHPLHRLLPILVYCVLSVVPKTAWIRWLGLGLVLHMLLDSMDCYSNI